MGDNPAAIAKYNEQQKKIEEGQAALERMAAGQQIQEDELRKEEAPWKRNMEKTATDLSKSFEMYMKQLHCAGEVRLQEADTYDKWGIEISVRFREGEKLSVLTATQQSG